MIKNHIKEHWKSGVYKRGESHWASWGDNWMIDLNIDTIGKHIKQDDRVLDVGCANEYSTSRQAESHKLASLNGVDIAASMVTAAQTSK
jgi:trans-aconitate methyltransferase